MDLVVSRPPELKKVIAELVRRDRAAKRAPSPHTRVATLICNLSLCRMMGLPAIDHILIDGDPGQLAPTDVAHVRRLLTSRWRLQRGHRRSP